KAIMVELNDFTTGSSIMEEEINYVAEIINKFLSKQDKTSRVLFLRRYYFGDSIAQAAECVGVTENNASVKLSRMRQKLKTELEKEGITV
ncbi:MAG: sigma-70 family RNA polymerase sigma factor, partial [Clostridia bacterium]|nr:sigma-70 family RNA polymerase sigma factor [Clostridia bacterium]